MAKQSQKLDAAVVQQVQEKIRQKILEEHDGARKTALLLTQWMRAPQNSSKSAKKKNCA